MAHNRAGIVGACGSAADCAAAFVQAGHVGRQSAVVAASGHYLARGAQLSGGTAVPCAAAAADQQSAARPAVAVVRRRHCRVATAGPGPTATKVAAGVVPCSAGRQSAPLLNGADVLDRLDLEHPARPHAARLPRRRRPAGVADPLVSVLYRDEGPARL